MSDEKKHPCNECLPASLPVFPLAGVLLLPRARLPLNIFEPRYIAMIDDALGPMAETKRLIGMIQPHADKGPDEKSLYKVGCAGRIVSFAETDDGRYLLTLEGVCRFTVAEELPATRGYRRITPVWDNFTHDLSADEETATTFSRERLIGALRPYFKLHGIVANWETIDELSAEKLVAAVAGSCPFSATEKQALLEADNLGERFGLLLTLLDMAARERRTHDGDGMRH